ncbi:hypothetical protein [Bdellovibrio sp. HCB209]|uniref:hypothetical protein n=1 Tax=Bdellovibrio sp. HCB209 TaxID=3394354 RepID=UPI0039B37355
MQLSEQTVPSPSPLSIDEQYKNARALLREALKATGRVYLSHRTDDHFYQLSDQEQLDVIKGIGNWANTVLEFVASGGDHRNTKNLVRYYLARMSLLTPMGFIDNIVDGDIVEIYGDDAKRLFFNPELFDYSSYAPDVMFSNQWWNLYQRDGDISQKIHDYCIDIFVGRKADPFVPDLPVCEVTEIKSRGRYTSSMMMKSMSPVKVGDKVVGVACLERLKLLSGEQIQSTHPLS